MLNFVCVSSEYSSDTVRIHRIVTVRKLNKIHNPMILLIYVPALCTEFASVYQKLFEPWHVISNNVAF